MKEKFPKNKSRKNLKWKKLVERISILKKKSKIKIRLNIIILSTLHGGDIKSKIFL